MIVITAAGQTKYEEVLLPIFPGCIPQDQHIGKCLLNQMHQFRSAVRAGFYGGNKMQKIPLLFPHEKR